VLTGKCKFNPGVGNAFRFDNNDTPEAQNNRKKGAAIGWVVLAVAAVVGFAIGWTVVTIL
jgi:hypothetical protein